MTQVVTADAGQMLPGLHKAGITGLALVPEGLRHVFFFGKPLLGPQDFRGATVRVPRSDTTYALFEALGATADDFPGGQTETGVAAGTVTAAESSFECLDGGEAVLQQRVEMALGHGRDSDWLS